MINNNFEKGFAAPMIIVIVVLVIVVGGIGYFVVQPKPAPLVTSQIPAEEKMVLDDAMVKPDEKMMNKSDSVMKNSFDVVIAKAPRINLKDVSKSGASGVAQLAVYNSKTYHRIVAKNMPNPSGTDFYEGWLVGNGLLGEVFSTGKMKYNPVTKEAILDIIVDGDQSDYRFVVVTVEPDDGNPKSAKHVLEGRFSKDINLQVVLDAMMEKKEGEMMMKKENGAMMTKYTGTVLAGKSALLLDYNKADYDTAIASDKLVVLYFYANWCPICKNETANALYPAFNELTNDKVVGIRINYKDSDTDKDEENLARQYGIPYQHTKVFLKNGKQLLKSPEGWEKTRYLTEINKALTQ